MVQIGMMLPALCLSMPKHPIVCVCPWYAVDADVPIVPRSGNECREGMSGLFLNSLPLAPFTRPTRGGQQGTLKSYDHKRWKGPSGRGNTRSTAHTSLKS